jgi:hypothetical protein
MKEMVKKVMDGDKMIPVGVLYSLSIVAVAMDVTAAGVRGHIPAHGNYILDATLINKDNAKDFYFKDSLFWSRVGFALRRKGAFAPFLRWSQVMRAWRSPRPQGASSD